MSRLGVVAGETGRAEGGCAFPRYRVFGVPVTVATGPELVGLVVDAVDTGRHELIVSQNLHGVHTYLHEPDFRRLHERPGTVVHIDGTPIIWAGRLRKLPIGGEHRTGLIDWIGALLEAASDGGWKVYHLGGDERELAAGLGAVRRQHPGIDIRGHEGFFDATPGSQANSAVLSDIERIRPDVLLIGMGMGRQEKWLLNNLHALDVAAIITVGSVMRLLTGELRTPPRWTGRLGVEWLCRFAQQPRTTFRRYFVEPWQIAWMLVMQRLGLRA